MATNKASSRDKAPDPAAAQVPSGYRVEVVAFGLTGPTSIEFALRKAVEPPRQPAVFFERIERRIQVVEQFLPTFEFLVRQPAAERHAADREGLAGAWYVLGVEGGVFDAEDAGYLRRFWNRHERRQIARAGEFLADYRPLPTRLTTHRRKIPGRSRLDRSRVDAVWPSDARTVRT